MSDTLNADKAADGGLRLTPCCPSLDCSHAELVDYIRSMKGGERVMDMERSGMFGHKGTVEVRDGDVCIRWDHAEYADGAGVMVTSFTGGARIIQDNVKVMAHPLAGANIDCGVRVKISRKHRKQRG